MQKKYIVRLTDEERGELREVIGKLKGTGQKVRRAQILLKADADGPNWTDQKIAEAFEPERARRLVRRIEFHHTPKHGSWLNIAENELRSLTRQCVSGRRFADIPALQEEASAWSTDVNSTQRGVDWQMKIDDARCKLKSVSPEIKL